MGIASNQTLKHYLQEFGAHNLLAAYPPEIRRKVRELAESSGPVLGVAL